MIQIMFYIFLFGLGVTTGLLWADRIEQRREYQQQQRHHRARCR